MKLSLITLLVSALSLLGQFRDTEYSDPRTRLLAPAPSGSIFNLEDISVSHSFSMNYISSGSESYMLNEYVAGLKYQISDPLTLRLNLGMSYTPYSSPGMPGEDRTDIYLKSATLDYKPSDKFRMVIDFRSFRPGDMRYYDDPFKTYNFLNEDK
jgi:hypothetical protein